jgi:hypothetical protein
MPPEPPAPRRLSTPPFPEYHDRLLTFWAWAKRRSKSALVVHTMEARIEANKDLINEMIETAAKTRGISVDEMEALILENPRYGWSDTDSVAD